MIKSKTVGFNLAVRSQTDFVIKTSSGDNTTPNQKFVSCRGNSIYDIILDDFSPSDDPDGFAPFPDPNHKGLVITVEEFVRIY
jgi:hypothetical protein